MSQEIITDLSQNGAISLPILPPEATSRIDSRYSVGYRLGQYARKFTEKYGGLLLTLPLFSPNGEGPVVTPFPTSNPEDAKRIGEVIGTITPLECLEAAGILVAIVGGTYLLLRKPVQLLGGSFSIPEAKLEAGAHGDGTPLSEAPAGYNPLIREDVQQGKDTGGHIDRDEHNKLRF